MTTFFLRNNERKGVEISLSPSKTQICIFRKEVISSDNFVFTLQIPAHQYSQGSAQITAEVKLNLYFWQLSSRVILPIIKTNISRMMWIKRPRPSIWSYKYVPHLKKKHISILVLKEENYFKRVVEKQGALLCEILPYKIQTKGRSRQWVSSSDMLSMLGLKNESSNEFLFQKCRLYWPYQIFPNNPTVCLKTWSLFWSIDSGSVSRLLYNFHPSEKGNLVWKKHFRELHLLPGCGVRRYYIIAEIQ